MRSILLVTALLLLLGPAPAAAQLPAPEDLGGAVMTRSDLERLLELYELTAESPAYSDAVRASARVNADRVRVRLEEGDFKVGDRVALSVEGEELPEELTVEAGPSITIPVFGTFSLRGVLRSEIEEHMTRELGKIIRDPVVQAQGLMRVAIRGAVLTPGFFVLPTDMLVSDALMAAGGPSPAADLTRLRVERGSDLIVGGEELQEAVIEGYTLDQLNMQAGDQIYVPDERQSFFSQIGRFAVIVVGALFLGIRSF